MSILKLNKYKRNRVEKLETWTTGIAIERKHKVFIDSHGLNLSAIVRDCLDLLMSPTEDRLRAQARKLIEVFKSGKSVKADFQKLEEVLKEEEEDAE